MRIAHIVADLDGFGGTEMNLLRYLKGSSLPAGSQMVFVIKSAGTGDTIGAQIIEIGVPVVELHEKCGAISIGGMLRLYRALRKFGPDVLSGWLYHPSLIATAISPLLADVPTVVWHVRSLTFSSFTRTPGRHIVQRLLLWLSRVTKPLIASNSMAAIHEHRALGFRIVDNSLAIIGNGVDLEEFCPDDSVRARLRQRLGIPQEAFVIGCIGRFVPEKGYMVLFGAVDSLMRKLNTQQASGLHVLIAGNGMERGNQALEQLLPMSLPPEQIHLLGRRGDVPDLLRCVDAFVLSSISEAMPNVLIEAMATGLPCVASDVGECRNMLGRDDFVFAAGNTEALCDRLYSVLSFEKCKLMTIGAENRERARKRFGLTKMISEMDQLFERACKRRPKS